MTDKIIQIIRGEETNPIRKCPECHSDKIIRDNETGELICEECGFVIDSWSIVFSPEWRTFTIKEYENLPRMVSPINVMMHDNGFSTNIGWIDVDGTGKRMNVSQKHKFYRLRKLNHRIQVRETNQQNLASALNYIRIIGDNLNLPKNVIETASINNSSSKCFTKFSYLFLMKSLS